MSSNAEKRKTSIIARPKSPNMLDLRRRFKQALSAKVRTATSVWTDSWKSFGHGFVKHEIKMSTKFWKTKVIPRNWRRVQNRLPLYSLAWTVDHCQVVVLKMGMSDCGSRQTIWSLLLGSLLDALQGLFVELFNRDFEIHAQLGQNFQNHSVTLLLSEIDYLSVTSWYQQLLCSMVLFYLLEREGNHTLRESKRSAWHEIGRALVFTFWTALQQWKVWNPYDPTLISTLWMRLVAYVC